MNRQVKKLVDAALVHAKKEHGICGFHPEHVSFTEKLVKSIVYDVLNDLTNDDSLDSARIKTIQKLAKKWGVANKNVSA